MADERSEKLTIAAERIDLLQGAIERVIRGKPEAVRLAMVTLLAAGARLFVSANSVHFRSAAVGCHWRFGLQSAQLGF